MNIFNKILGVKYSNIPFSADLQTSFLNPYNQPFIGEPQQKNGNVKYAHNIILNMWYFCYTSYIKSSRSNLNFKHILVTLSFDSRFLRKDLEL